jgi:hypothetical protein
MCWTKPGRLRRLVCFGSRQLGGRARLLASKHAHRCPSAPHFGSASRLAGFPVERVYELPPWNGVGSRRDLRLRRDHATAASFITVARIV